ncbi:unnamed protein product [Schistosoma mattheei]|uniref:Uncharacterized protein n=1 Tax=Schistosoma mattheei TaxID=31246 RepID=A0A183PKW7_9TREM|nr:unnamed protein product [Schistosoma mattheei]
MLSFCFFLFKVRLGVTYFSTITSCFPVRYTCSYCLYVIWSLFILHTQCLQYSLIIISYFHKLLSLFPFNKCDLF